MWRGLTIEQRLWGRSVWTQAGCLEFQGSKVGNSGYGGVYFNGRTQPAHRVAWQIARGEIPSSGGGTR